MLAPPPYLLSDPLSIPSDPTYSFCCALQATRKSGDPRLDTLILACETLLPEVLRPRRAPLRSSSSR